MAPTVPQRAAPESPPAASTTSTTHRISKSRSERTSSSRSCMTRQRSKMLAEGSRNGVLQDMVDEAQVVAGGSASPSGSSRGRSKGKGTAAVTPTKEDEQIMEGIEQAAALQEDMCPVAEKHAKPFRIMDLPAEIRLEIFRACLTRPYNILLSKREKPMPPPESDTRDSDSFVTLESTVSDDDDPLLTTVARPVRASRAQPSTASQSLHVASHRANLASNARGMASRGSRPLRLVSSRSAPLPPTANNSNSNGNAAASVTSTPIFRPSASTSHPGRRYVDLRSRCMVQSEPPRQQNQDPLIVNILSTTKQIYKEARSVLYSENLFTLDLNTAMPTLACLHQRSRRQIKHVEIEIPTYNEILERFQETVRLSLRYCSGLKEFVIHMPFTLPGADGSGTTGNTTVYANGFDILRWLPQECNINLQGNICTEIETVVNKHQHLAKTLDKVRHRNFQYSPYAERVNLEIEQDDEKAHREAEAAAAQPEQ